MKLLTSKEVAEMLSVSLMTLKRWRLAGEGPAFIYMSRNSVRYKLEDIEKFVEERRNART